ncbi:MAG: hypothetical protein IJP54_06815 [Synergistaceae bacterium]|nr:hypothetical protein [Synergistaceae bacterium]
MYVITLSDGTRLENLKLNGNNFITTHEISEATFSGKLSHVKIECNDDDMKLGGIRGEFSNMELVQCKKYGAEWWFILREIPQEKYELLRLAGNVDYVAMMTGVEL